MKPRLANGRREAGGGRLPSTFHLKPSTMGSASFTLIEMIGVMAVMGVMAAILVPPLINRLQDAQVVSEDEMLNTIAEAILAKAKKSGTLPNPNVSPFASNGWVTFAQEYFPGNSNRLAYVFERQTNSVRRVYFDNDLIGFNGINFAAPSSPGPVKGRMYIVSSSRRDLVLTCPTNGASNPSTALLSDLANWVKQTNSFGFFEVPASVANWRPVAVTTTNAGGTNTNTFFSRGEFLHVKTVDFGNFKIGRDLDQEDKNLEEIARALLQGIKTEGRFPDPNVSPTSSNGWANLASRYSTLGSNAVLRVYPNNTNDTERRYYLDPTFLAALSGSFTTPSNGWTSTNILASPVMYLISSSRPDFTLACSNGVNLSAVNLSWVRNWTKTNFGALVAATNIDIVQPNWTNRGEYLHVRVVNLSDLICKVDLYDDHTPCASYSNQKNSPGGFTPTASTWSTNGFTIQINDTNAVKWENDISIVTQPKRVPLSYFTNQITGGGAPIDPWRLMGISISLTNKSTKESDNYGYLIQAGDSPFFSINGSSTNRLTFFDTLNSTDRRDSANFYILFGSNLRLTGSTSTNVQININVSKNLIYRFTQGAWEQQ